MPRVDNVPDVPVFVADNSPSLAVPNLVEGSLLRSEGTCVFLEGGDSSSCPNGKTFVPSAELCLDPLYDV